MLGGPPTGRSKGASRRHNSQRTCVSPQIRRLRRSRSRVASRDSTSCRHSRVAASVQWPRRPSLQLAARGSHILPVDYSSSHLILQQNVGGVNVRASRAARRSGERALAPFSAFSASLRFPRSPCPRPPRSLRSPRLDLAPSECHVPSHASMRSTLRASIMA
ncbi:hypothetical protein CC85DRAFT_118736 [Cutaneotrichosporon oleaginosum]|uniref:Uncharacterized protein n=1 Tax=Cutaneotrichosporon oleaginosum TaxID=879819 RepID=A0A0J0XKG9_9TREE|nr:uncharacterized protein CC85DRAFT_118736 [Cutaneotrichosporon oleaginosum]KLT41580.1 hypothetical protein CC85DRAFT_118736 [Cutaneotrichosporon oleaginosum]TXT09346.1 hypothetical protein COLE_03280 [Cutaneotrichosporon oleaginosum]